MFARPLKIGLLAFQTFWMLVVLPGHVRGMVALGDDPCCETRPTAVRSCCAADPSADRSKAADPSPERKSRCAVCNNAHGYAVPPVYDFHPAPSGFCELCRLIEPSRRHLLLCRPTYFATAPPVA